MTVVNTRQGGLRLASIASATSAIASCVAASTSVTLHLLTTNRTVIIRKLHIKNNNAAATMVQIGTGITGVGGGFVQAIPDIEVLAGMDLQLTEDQILAVEFSGNITVQATVAAAAPNNVAVAAEVEEFMGTSG